MRRRLGAATAIAFAAVFAPRLSDAKCVFDFKSVFPPVDVALPVNGRIVLTRMGAPFRDGLEPRADALALSADGDRVPLRVIETNPGVMQTQWVLIPTRPLRPETRYALRTQNDDGSDGPALGDQQGDFAWSTGATVDQNAPRWRARPRAGERVYRKLGCGPEMLVKISVDVSDTAVIRVVLRPAGAAKTSRYLIEPRDGLIDVGHHMCGGAFALEHNQRYLATLTAIDAAGNETPAPGPPLEIVAPDDGKARSR